MSNSDKHRWCTHLYSRFVICVLCHCTKHHRYKLLYNFPPEFLHLTHACLFKNPNISDCLIKKVTRDVHYKLFLLGCYLQCTFTFYQVLNPNMMVVNLWVFHRFHTSSTFTYSFPHEVVHNHLWAIGVI